METKIPVKPEQSAAQESPWSVEDRALRLLWEICWFLLCEAHFLPAKLLQTSPATSVWPPGLNLGEAGQKPDSLKHTLATGAFHSRQFRLG